ncbi:hypothetical protein V6N12_038940 [Hibiscus sabdariffa]|uniref:Uncharacterized protein n=1 Tax=Hibiscus sabdariffa TaxID=183260 RepID=A0ABR2DZ74_9ROSI
MIELAKGKEKCWRVRPKIFLSSTIKVKSGIVLSIELDESYQSSPSSSNGNSPLAISTRKPRTPRKRPNQTYNEAAALLSTAYPYLFSAKNFTKPPKFTKPHHSSFFHNSSDLLLFPFRVIHDSGFLLHNQPKLVESKLDNVCNKSSWASDTSSGEVNSHGGGGGGGGCSMEREVEFQDDIDAKSILEEESEEGRGIDSIMGKLSVKQETWEEKSMGGNETRHNQVGCSWYTNAMRLRKGVGGALRNVEQQANWWNFSTVDLQQISPKTNTHSSGGRAEKKKKKNKGGVAVESPNAGLKLKLKLNYEEVVNAWCESDGGSPFSQEPHGLGNDIYIDLLSEAEGGVREASVLRYKQKRHTRLFSTKIRAGFNYARALCHAIAGYLLRWQNLRRIHPRAMSRDVGLGGPGTGLCSARNLDPKPKPTKQGEKKNHPNSNNRGRAAAKTGDQLFSKEFISEDPLTKYEEWFCK